MFKDLMGIAIETGDPWLDKKLNSHICYGGGKGSDTPDTPDPEETIRAQAKYNRINTYTPFGSLTYSNSPAQTRTVTRQIGGGGGGKTGRNNPIEYATFEETIPGSGGIKDIATLTLSPEQQRQLDLQNIISENVLMGGIDRINQLPGTPPDYSLQGANFNNPIFERAASSLRPEFENQQERLNSDLANRGIPLNSDAFNDAQNRLSDRQNKQLTDIATNTALQDIGLQQQNRQTQFNELASILGFQQVSPSQQGQIGSFIQPGSVDVLGANQLALQGDIANQQAQAQGRSDLLGGLFGLGSAAILGGLF